MSYSNGWNEIFGAIILVLIVLAIAGFFICLFQIAPDNWNDGICSDCGGQYAFSHVVGNSADIDFIYQCTTCGKIICTENQIKIPLTNS